MQECGQPSFIMNCIVHQHKKYSKKQTTCMKNL